MAEWKRQKWIRRFYELDEEDESIKFVYCNWTYWGSSVSLVNMLYEEILSDFPNELADNVHVERRNKLPFELTLSLYFPAYEAKNIDLSKFEKLPDDF